VETFTAFLLSVVAGARRFAHTSLLRADVALRASLGMARFPSMTPFATGSNASARGSASVFLRLVELAARAASGMFGGTPSGLGFDGVRCKARIAYLIEGDLGLVENSLKKFFP
jgi:hypothetical protein